MGRRDALGLAARLTLGLGNWQLKIKAAPKATGRKKKTTTNKQKNENKKEAEPITSAPPPDVGMEYFARREMIGGGANLRFKKNETKEQRCV